MAVKGVQLLVLSHGIEMNGFQFCVLMHPDEATANGQRVSVPRRTPHLVSGASASISTKSSPSKQVQPYMLNLRKCAFLTEFPAAYKLPPEEARCSTVKHAIVQEKDDLQRVISPSFMLLILEGY